MANQSNPRPDEDRMAYLQRRQAERRRSQRLSALFTALAIFAVIGLIIFFLCGGFSRFSGLLRSDAPGQKLAQEQQASAVTDDELTTVTLTAVGDICISDEQIADAATGSSSYDFSPAFLGAAELLAESDLTLGNLECSFNGAPYDGAAGNAPEALAASLAGFGFDLLQTANSYSISGGLDGLRATRSQIEQAGMQPVGTFDSAAQRADSHGVTLCEVKGVRIAFIAFTKGLNNMSLPEGAGYAVNLLYRDYDSTYTQLDRDGIVSAMQEAQKAKPDLIIALVHWGSEYESGVSDSQKTVEELLYANGANAILGTHSHIAGPIDAKTYTAEDGSTRDVLTAYDLGNFYTSSTKPGSQLGLALQLEFTRNNWTGETVLSGYHYTPVYCADNGAGTRNRYQVLDAANAIALYNENYVYRISDAVYESLQAELADLPDQIAPPQAEDTAE